MYTCCVSSIGRTVIVKSLKDVGSNPIAVKEKQV